ncbi:MAG: ATP-binding protein, partial [Nocardioides sp.]|nr:ATP-binding protein [Nocardioides sp.]
MPETRYAVEVAAAGGHHLLLKGPKGCGKTSIAERIPTILPDLDAEEALEVMAVQSLAGVLDVERGLLTRPPFAAPHHDASRAGIIGGGNGRVRPGEISLAHAGVLFMDEFPLFRSDVLESLREPLESGDITVARGEESVTLPARSLVVMAANPCPCGNLDDDASKDRCTCRSNERRDYGRRVSGPVTDRIDIIRNLRPMAEQNHDPWGSETSEAIRERVAMARRRQRERYAGHAWRLNAQASGVALRDHWPLPAQAEAMVDQRVFGGSLTRRGAVRVHRLAWTIADLAGVSWPGVRETDIALRLRAGERLPVEAYEGRVA